MVLSSEHTRAVIYLRLVYIPLVPEVLQTFTILLSFCKTCFLQEGKGGTPNSGSSGKRRTYPWDTLSVKILS